MCSDGGLRWCVEPICTVLSEHGIQSGRRQLLSELV